MSAGCCELSVPASGGGKSAGTWQFMGQKEEVESGSPPHSASHSSTLLPARQGVTYDSAPLRSTIRAAAAAQSCASCSQPVWVLATLAAARGAAALQCADLCSLPAHTGRTRWGQRRCTHRRPGRRRSTQQQARHAEHFISACMHVCARATPRPPDAAAARCSFTSCCRTSGCGMQGACSAINISCSCVACPTCWLCVTCRSPAGCGSVTGSLRQKAATGSLIAHCHLTIRLAHASGRAFIRPAAAASPTQQLLCCTRAARSGRRQITPKAAAGAPCSVCSAGLRQLRCTAPV